VKYDIADVIERQTYPRANSDERQSFGEFSKQHAAESVKITGTPLSELFKQVKQNSK
jgi:hypothetical protein